MKNGDFLSTSSADGVFLLFSTVTTTVLSLLRQMHSDKSNDSFSSPLSLLFSLPLSFFHLRWRSTHTHTGTNIEIFIAILQAIIEFDRSILRNFMRQEYRTNSIVISFQCDEREFPSRLPEKKKDGRWCWWWRQWEQRKRRKRKQQENPIKNRSYWSLSSAQRIKKAKSSSVLPLPSSIDEFSVLNHVDEWTILSKEIMRLSSDEKINSCVLFFFSFLFCCFCFCRWWWWWWLWRVFLFRYALVVPSSSFWLSCRDSVSVVSPCLRSTRWSNPYSGNSCSIRYVLSSINWQSGYALHPRSNRFAHSNLVLSQFFRSAFRIGDVPRPWTARPKPLRHSGSRLCRAWRCHSLHSNCTSSSFLSDWDERERSFAQASFDESSSSRERIDGFLFFSPFRAQSERPSNTNYLTNFFFTMPMPVGRRRFFDSNSFVAL